MLLACTACSWDMMQAAARGSDHASDSSAREEPREATSSQEGGGRSAELPNLQHPTAAHGRHPSSQSSLVSLLESATWHETIV